MRGLVAIAVVRLTVRDATRTVARDRNGIGARARSTARAAVDAIACVQLNFAAIVLIRVAITPARTARESANSSRATCTGVRDVVRTCLARRRRAAVTCARLRDANAVANLLKT